jgi:hypothetical protein|tara:strand:+ start:886 stop:1128 length:243 start_codon:yes stop_codon:yes gene_type:complete
MVRRMAKVIGRKAAQITQTSTLVNIETTRNMVLENSCGSLVPNTRVIMSMISNRAMVKCTGSTEAFTEASGKTAFNQDLV